jgi:hypothetical protein
VLYRLAVSRICAPRIAHGGKIRAAACPRVWRAHAP